METRKYIHEGSEYRLVKYPSYEALKALKEAYEVIGKKAWLNLWDCSRGLWALTVEIGKA